ncbi:hypothetical protein [Lentibacillus cibarius]|uniref:DUF5683 domain-containing protein n=1 Tax=Lentibacillus cibarius TaxID=2583219 RepID=A0A5S3QK38_9BACI|nr:hypothetical protein [Lentibacillus cibarius]TMN22109.1 hypothetical protein FFL34_08210 [Lentibacillus cibarius]
MHENNKYEKLFWSIALPGFGQLLNGKYIKGIILIFLEFLVNVQGNFNKVIFLSFHGEIEKAIQQTDYHWLMFYPCLYFFAMWDAYKDAGGGKKPYSFLPFVFSAYFVTVGLIFSSDFTILGILIGPVWLPILAVVPGVGIGFFLQLLMNKWREKRT